MTNKLGHLIQLTTQKFILSQCGSYKFPGWSSSASRSLQQGTVKDCTVARKFFGLEVTHIIFIHRPLPELVKYLGKGAWKCEEVHEYLMNSKCPSRIL